MSDEKKKDVLSEDELQKISGGVDLPTGQPTELQPENEGMNPQGPGSKDGDGGTFSKK